MAAQPAQAAQVQLVPPTQPLQPLQPLQHALTPNMAMGGVPLKVPLPAPSDWSFDEDVILENALAEFWEAPDRVERAASRLPLRSVDQVRHRMRLLEDDVANIDAGRVPLPNYSSAQEHTSLERRKGIPWTEEEHRLFLMGLAKFGKGDWRSISRNYVISRTPTQVASHAQKYFIRLNSLNKKDKRRSSIHDITSPGGNTGEVTGMMPQTLPNPGVQHNGVMSAVGPGGAHLGPRAAPGLPPQGHLAPFQQPGGLPAPGMPQASQPPQMPASGGQR